MYLRKLHQSRELGQLMAAWHVIECVLKLYRPAGRKLLGAYIETGTIG